MKRIFLNLKLKIILIIIALFSCLLMILLGIVHHVMIINIRNVEDIYLKEQSALALKAIDYEINSVHMLTYDWAVWDDSYYYMLGQKPDYIESNFSEETFENLKIDRISFINTNDQIVPISDREFDLNHSIAEVVSRDQLNRLVNMMESQKQKKCVCGIIKTDTNYLILSLYPISLTDESGEDVGYLVMGRWLNLDLIEQLNGRYNLKMNLTDDLQDQGVQLSSDEELIFITSAKEDIFGEQNIGITVTSKRTLYGICKLASNLLSTSIIIAMAIFGFLIFQLINTKLLHRVIKMSAGVNALVNGNEEFIYNPDTKKDEISTLHNSIREMYSTIRSQSSDLDEKNAELEELNASLEKRVEERTEEIKKANHKLQEKEENYRTIVSQFPDWIFQMDRNYRFLEYEGGKQEQLLMSPEHFIGKKVDEVMPLDLARLIQSKVDEAITTNEMIEFNYQIDMGNKAKEYEARLIPLKSRGVYAFIRDITDSQRTRREIEYLSYHDQLTGLYNRHYFVTEFNRVNVFRNMPLTLLSMDVNGLKLINDAFGHQMGDKLLRGVATAIRRGVRADEIIARLGGDEFAALLPNTSEETARIMIDRIKNEVNKIVINGVQMSISIGYSTTNDESTDVDYHLKLADEKMYNEKIQESQFMRENALTGIYNTFLNRDETDRIHSEYVTELSMRIGKEMDLSEYDMHHLRLAAMYHDIGMLGIPKEILSKRGKYTEREYTSVKRHSEIGYQIVNSVDSLGNVANIILHHHERFDGNGYPGGMKGDEIPLLSRIISLADAYETMIHYRSYKTQRTVEEAKKEIMKCSGTQFDPAIVSIFLQMR